MPATRSGQSRAGRRRWISWNGAAERPVAQLDRARHARHDRPRLTGLPRRKSALVHLGNTVDGPLVVRVSQCDRELSALRSEGNELRLRQAQTEGQSILAKRGGMAV